MFVGCEHVVALKQCSLDKANLCVNSFLCLDAYSQQVFKESESGCWQHVEHPHYE